MPVSLVGQKRTYVDAQAHNSKGVISVNSQEEKEGGDVQLKGLQDIIRGLESQKRRRIE